MELQNVFTGIKGKGTVIGGLVGFTTGSPNGFGDVLSSLQNLQNIHAPDIVDTFQNYLSEPFFRNGLLITIVGYAIDEFNLPVVGSWGSFLEKFGIGYMGGSLANKFLWRATH